MEPRDVFLLETIVDYCDRISKAIDNYGDSLEAFNDNLDYQDVCAFRIIQIGEYVNELSEAFKNSHPETPWREIVGLRNILTHEYGKLDNEAMWDTIKNCIPPLRKECARAVNK